MGLQIADWLKLRISFYPNPHQRKLIVAYGFKTGMSKTETIEFIVRKFFNSMPEHEVNNLIKLYDNDPTGEIKEKEKKNYITKE